MCTELVASTVFEMFLKNGPQTPYVDPKSDFVHDFLQDPNKGSIGFYRAPCEILQVLGALGRCSEKAFGILELPGKHCRN